MNKDASSTFQAAWWLKNSHTQTIWPSLLRRRSTVSTLLDRIELPDGDFIDLVWDRTNRESSGAPIVLLLHGLGGTIESHYVRSMMQQLSHRGWRPVLMYFRGGSGVPNRLPRGYHSGETEDMASVVARLQQVHPGAPIAAVGVSLGGNALLKWLGETGKSNPLACAVAVSVPFILSTVADRLNTGFSRLYQRRLIKKLVADAKEKFKKVSCPFEQEKLDTVSNFWEFDSLITAPVHGFKDVHDYYQKSSCRQHLKKIAVPTLIIHARDDPFMTPEVIPLQQELSETIRMEVSDHGGHVGFISGNIPGRPVYWLDKRVPDFLSTAL